VQVEGVHKAADTPFIVWQDKSDYVQPTPAAGQRVNMTRSTDERHPWSWQYSFATVPDSFALRVFYEDAFSRSIRVKVQPLPRLKESLFRLTPPAYTGQRAQTAPGPPAPVIALPGSTLVSEVVPDQQAQSLCWIEPGRTNAFRKAGARWEVTTQISAAGPYQLKLVGHNYLAPVSIAQGEIRLLSDNPPEVEFLTEDRNRFVHYGGSLKLEVAARDDFGLQSLELIARPADQEHGAALLRKWTYLGPPGNPGPVKETCLLEVDPQRFVADKTYYLEAVASDFRPGGSPGKSRPILLRVKSSEDLALPSDDPLAAAFAALKQTIASQQKANFLTANLKTYLDEALEKKTVPQHRQGMVSQQQAAQADGRQALTQFDRQPEGKPCGAALSPLVEREMTAVLGGLGKLPPNRKDQLATGLGALAQRQQYILDELLALLGRLAEQRDQIKASSNLLAAANPPITSPEDQAKDLVDELRKFTADQERVVERSRSLLDHGLQDLTKEQEELLGELTREEAKWAKFFEEKLTDFSKLPQQEFADSSLAKEFNEVFQEIQRADAALTQKNIELAVPHEQSGLENAKQLIHNLERWLPDTPDNIKWSMEEPLNPADVAVAELPAELEDIVGELLDKEEAMSPEVEDVTSSWMDSPDKGAGWDAMDGPISSMSARGVTGNRLPNQQEIGGRAGEGRTGRSHGQMVEETAEGKGGRETPTRLTPSPFESGSVKDMAKNDAGGATGGGKLSGAGAEGLRGPSPSTLNPKMPRLADRQAKVRQQAEALALRLRRLHVATGDLEGSARAMQQLEQAARKNDGLGVRRAYSGALDRLADAKQVLKAQAGVLRERVKLPPWMREEIKVGVQDGIPKGYEEMLGEYYRALAEAAR
jgi:hypothetical protein